MGPDGSRPEWTPPRWLNKLMVLMLRTPGLQRLVGKGTALLTFTGRKSGKTFTTPVTYMLHHGDAVFTCHEARLWWRNFAVHPEVTMRLAGRDRQGSVRVTEGDEAIRLLTALMEKQPVLARVNNVESIDSKLHLDQVTAMAAHTKVMVADLV